MNKYTNTASGLALLIAVVLWAYLKASGTVIMSREQVNSSISATLEALEESYIYPEVAAEMSRSVRYKMAGGEYDYVFTNFGLIDRLQSDLRFVSGDLHISLRPYRAAGKASGGVVRKNSKNHGIGHTEIFSNKIGYIQINSFSFGEEAQSALSEAIRGFAASEAIIIDLRKNGGGSANQSAYLAAIFLEPETLLWTYLGRNDEIKQEYRTQFVPDADVFKDIPLYVLTSKKTFSAAESFVWAMKLNNRATVVGEQTGGGAHTIKDIHLGNLFTLRTSIGRPFIPLGEKNWEASGLKPDIAVPSDRSLEEVLAMVNQAN